MAMHIYGWERVKDQVHLPVVGRTTTTRILTEDLIVKRTKASSKRRSQCSQDFQEGDSNNDVLYISIYICDIYLILIGKNRSKS